MSNSKRGGGADTDQTGDAASAHGPGAFPADSRLRPMS